MAKTVTQVRGNGEVASYSKMTVRYKGDDVHVDDLPRGTQVYLFNISKGKISRNSLAFEKRGDIAERIGQEYRKNMWYADEKVEVIEKSVLEEILRLRSVLRRVLI